MYVYLSLVLDERGSLKKDLKVLPLEEMDKFTVKFKDSDAIRKMYNEEIEKFLNEKKSYIDKCSKKNRGRICITYYNDQFSYNKPLIEFLPIFYQDDKKFISSKYQKSTMANLLIENDNFRKQLMPFIRENMPNVIYNKINYGLKRSVTKTFREPKVREGINYIDNMPNSYLLLRKISWETKKICDNNIKKDKKTEQDLLLQVREKEALNLTCKEFLNESASWYRDSSLLNFNIEILNNEEQIMAKEEDISKIKK